MDSKTDIVNTAGLGSSEETLRQKEAQLKAILQSTAEGILAVDQAGKIITLNNQFMKLLSIPAKIVETGKDESLLEYVLEQLKEPHSFLDKVKTLYGTTEEGLDILYFKDGRIFERYSRPLMQDKRVAGRVWSFRDITERKRTEDALKASENRYRAIVEDQTELICRFRPGGKLTFVNQAFCRYFRKEAAELLGSFFMPHIPEEDLHIVAEQHSLISPQCPVVTYELRVVLPGEDIRWQQWSDRALFDEQGEIVEFQSVGRDITRLKQSEQLLEQRREWYRALAEDIPALVCRVSPEENLTFANDAYCHFVGSKREEIIGKSIYTFIPPDNHARVKKSLASLNPEQATDNHEHTNRAFDGTMRWVKWTNRAIFDQAGKLKEYLSIGEDITEQKNVYKSLEESEALKSSIINAIPDILIRYDNEGRYLDILSRDHDILSFPAEQLLNRTVIEVLPEKLAHKLLSCIRAALQTGRLQTVEYSIDSPRGPQDFEARFKASSDSEVVAFIRKITEKKRFEDDLKISEERHRDILASIEEGYYEVNLAGNITFCNEAACRQLGYTRTEFLGISYRQLYRDPEAAYQTFNRVLLSGQPDRGFTMEMIRKDGSTVYGELSISPIRDKNGKTRGFRGVARDITERIRFEEQLRYLSLHDQLTGLYNRNFLEEEMKRLEESKEYPVTIITADLDDLKLINDTMGHERGDQMLIAAAAILQNSLRESDILARVGGDEFTAILPGTGEKTGEIIAASIRKNIALYNREHPNLPLGLSLGVSTANGEETAFRDLHKQADDLMYQDKIYRTNSAQGQIVQTLLAALTERDFIAEGHAQSLEELCRKVGERMKLSSRRLSDLALLAQVHDLGKVGIPDRILFKNGPLTDKEWETMRQHPEKGYRIAVLSTDLSEVAHLILRHHERWDGSGYPLGLKGDEIPVECRILAIADAYHALTTERPYNRAKSVKRALRELKRNSGSQFDPALVDIFISIIQAEKATEQHGETKGMTRRDQ